MASVRPAGGGAQAWVLELPTLEAALVLSLPDRVEAVLSHPEQNRRLIDRLFPASYSDPREEREHRELLGASMLDERQAMLAGVRKALSSATRDRKGMTLSLDVRGVDQFLRFVNDLRLMISTELGIETNLSELSVDPKDPDAPRYSLLVYLTGLEALLVDAVSGDDAS
ncbi:MAG: DUF2017 family protein [Planctomycetota bacterium]|jgi:hypothetical protein